MLLAATILLALVSMAVCHRIAKARSSNPVFWGVMGALFGPLAIPFALFSRPRRNRARRHRARPSATSVAD